MSPSHYPQPTTSQTSPLQIDSVSCRKGLIGLTLCPGKHQEESFSGPWAHDLSLDIAAIRDWGADLVVTLMEDHELRCVKVTALPDAVAAAGMAWIHLPICDQEAPDNRFLAAWPDVSQKIHALLADGGCVVVHCRSGLGRSGTVAAQLLVEAGEPPGAAIYRVRAARPGAIETRAQEDYVLRLGPV